MSEDKQAVVDDTKAPALQGAAVDNARDDVSDQLDKWLSEYDDAIPKTDAVTPPVTATAATTPTLEQLAQQVQETRFELTRRESAELAKQDEDATNSLIKEISDDLEVDEFIAEGLVHAFARKDPNGQKVVKAFANRREKPGDYEKAKSYMKRELPKKLANQPDKQATEDRALVAQSVRGASTKVGADPPPKLGKMSNSQLRKHVIEEYGYDPGVG